MTPPSSQPSDAVAVEARPCRAGRRPGTGRARRSRAARASRAPRTSSNGSMTACWSEPSESARSGVVQPRGPGRCRRRGRARWSGRSTRRCRVPPSSSMSLSDRWVACTAVVRGAEQPLPRRAARSGERRRNPRRRGSRRAAPTGARAAAGRRGRDVADHRQVVARHRAHRVHGRADPHRSRRRTAAATRSAHASTVPSRNRCCTSSSGDVAAAVEPAREVAGVEQREPDAGLARRLTTALPIDVRVVVAAAARPVVHVVELADDGVCRPAPSRRRPPWRARSRCRGRGGASRHTSRRASVQKLPPSPWMRPRRARWKAWLWALARPGRTTPARRMSSGSGRRSARTSLIRPPSVTTRTERRTPPGSHACSHQNVVMHQPRRGR